jgi:hypothetical protein
MSRPRRIIGPLGLALLLAGCGGGVTPENLPADQKAVDYGQKSAHQMVEQYGIPGKGGAMEKAATPAK